MTHTADIGLIGLAVMGQNLALNIAEHGFHVAVYNRSVDKTRAFLDGPARDLPITGVEDLAALVASLQKPRIVWLMVKAGEAVDATLAQLLPYLEPGDIVIDGGNSLFTDTRRRTEQLRAHGVRFVGCGVSGGEEGARHGPALMPGGAAEAWPHIQPILHAIAAKVEGRPCCDWVGDDGAGHFVKMVHNGIEYGDMQIIGEAYHLLSAGLGMPAEATQRVFAEWNQGVLQSYLIEITADILRHRTAEGAPLVEVILDCAGQKGTGKWTAIDALNLGVPLTLIAEAVFARCLSAQKDQRVRAAAMFPNAPRQAVENPATFITALQHALYAAKIISYAQGFELLHAAAAEYRWILHYDAIALSWRGGCIIRSRFLNDIASAYQKTADLPHLLFDEFFGEALRQADASWRQVIRQAVAWAIPVPALAAALSYFDSWRSARLPANLLQAQRDYFGAHQYERIDRPRGEFFHTDWTGHGGSATSSRYNA